MATLLQSIAAGSRKADGSANAGGRVFLTSPGTDIPVTAYQDRDKTAQVALNNAGYLLGSDGRSFLFVDVPCQVREETSDGTLVAFYSAGSDVAAGLVEVTNAGFTGTMPDGTQAAGGRTYLNAVLSALAGSIGVDGLYKAAANGVGMSVSDWMTGTFINVKAMGAVGNGVKDDTVAIQAAINLASAFGGVVFFPPGTYLVSATLVIQAQGVEILGSGTTTTIIQTTDITINAFNFNGVSSAPLSCRISKLGFACSGFSSAAAILVSGSTGVFIENIVIAAGLFRFGVQVNTNASLTVIHGCGLVVNGSDALSTAIDIPGSGGTVFVSNTRLTSFAAHGIQVTAGVTLIVTGVSTIAGATAANGITITGAGSVYVAASRINGGATGHGVSISATAVEVSINNAVRITPDVLDNRAGSPVNFPLAGTAAVTPLPLQSDVTRIIQSGAGATTTINAPAAAATGKVHTIICSNTSGGALTWTFNAAFIMTAGAVAPGTGNRTMLTFVYDAISAKWYESATRNTTAN